MRHHPVPVLLPLLLASLSAPARAQFDDPYAVYTGSNLILEGSSFETGRDGFGVIRRMHFQQHQTDGFLLEPLAFDSGPGAAVHGERSLKIVNHTEDLVSLEFPWMPLSTGPGATYTVSFWARAQKDPGEPPGAMKITAKVIGQPVSGSNVVMQQGFSLDGIWTRYESTPFALAPNTMVDDLVWLQFFTGPWKSSLGANDVSRLQGTIWLDGVQLAATGQLPGYEYPPDEPLELGAWTRDATGPRTGNLFHGDDPVIRARVRLFADAWSGPVVLDYSLVDSFGDVFFQGSSAPLTLVAGTGSAVTIPLRKIPAPPIVKQLGGVYLAGGDRSPALDRLAGRLGVFRMDLVARDGSTGAVLGTEELTLCVIEPDGSGPDPGSPFGVHVHFLTENLVNGWSGPSDPHDHIVTTSVDQNWIFDALEDAGFKWLRDFSFASWAAIQPTGPSDWITCDHTLDLCESHGLELLPVLGWTGPWWANTGLGGSSAFVNWQTPRTLPDVGAWTAYVTGMLAEYSGRIDAWEITNEPYFYYDIPEYADVFLGPARAAFDAAAGGAPQLVAPAGGIAWWDDSYAPPGNFIDQLFLDEAAGEAIDVLSEHFYVKKNPPFEKGFQQNPATWLGARIGKYLAQRIGDNTPGSNTAGALWDGEAGQVIGTLRTDTRVFAQDYRSPPFNQSAFLDELSGDFSLNALVAAYLVRAYVVELAWGVERFFVHTTRQGGGSPASAGGQRLLDWDDTPNHAYAALAAMMGRLRGADYAQARRIEGGVGAKATVFAYVFDRQGIPVAVVWDYAEDGSFPLLGVALPSAAITAYDMMGNALALTPAGPGAFFLTPGNLPVYLEGDGVVVNATALGDALQAAIQGTVPPAR